jgi:hypothetical protein
MPIFSSTQDHSPTYCTEIKASAHNDANNDRNVPVSIKQHPMLTTPQQQISQLRLHISSTTRALMRHPLIPKNRSCSIIDWPTGQETVLIQARAAERRRNSVQCAWPNPLTRSETSTLEYSLSSECDNLCHCLVTFTSQQPLEDIYAILFFIFILTPSHCLQYTLKCQNHNRHTTVHQFLTNQNNLALKNPATLEHFSRCSDTKP